MARCYPHLVCLLWIGSAFSLLAQQAPETPTLPEVVVEPNAPQSAPSDPADSPFLAGDPFNPPPNDQPPVPSPLFQSGLFGREFGRGANLTGETNSASSGTFGPADILSRPLLRPTSALEIIPGLVVTQHSGSGKANQYFLRGVNLDHGTDFFVRVDGVPINLPTNGHGQGYLDLNWLIPELLDTVTYRLGTYYADVGDFSSVGTADITYARTLTQGIGTITAGSFDYYRLLAADSTKVGQGDLLYAFEGIYNNGPWDVPEHFNKFNGVLKYTQGDNLQGFSLSALAYHADWTATNQIAQRAVDAGIVGRFGSLDPTDGGITNRVTLNGQAWHETDLTRTTFNSYVVGYDLNLFSNFTYFLDDPVNGDQINQIDHRIYTGCNLAHEVFNDFGSNTIGFQFRNDSIGDVALNHTDDRLLINPVTRHAIDQQVWSVYAVNNMRWTDYLRTNLGVREDFYRFHGQSVYTPLDSGTVDANIFSPKTSLILGPWQNTELFLNWGLSFHSNDARGVLDAANPATPLVRSNGSEIGMRSRVNDAWTTTFTLWYLEIASELVFVGDAGTTEPSLASHRGGFNWTNFYQINDWTRFDCDYAYVRPRLEGGLRIPNAIENVVNSGVTIRDPNGGWFSSWRWIVYGPAALTEDNSARSTMTNVMDLQAGYNWKQARLQVDVFNFLNSKTNDITYFYESAPPGLPPAGDYHFHPVIPVSARASFTYLF